jgi:hypothetical protein
LIMNKQQIAEKLRANHQNFVDFVLSLTSEEFLSSVDNKWTAGQQLDHIVRGVSPVKRALGLPKFVPKLLFGEATRSSTSYEHLVSNYQGKLALGSKATGRFIPPQISLEKRESLKNSLLKTVNSLCQKLGNFDESQLDQYLLPHPILGKLTFREMLYFTIYHVEHHHRAVLKILGK